MCNNIHIVTVLNLGDQENKLCSDELAVQNIITMQRLGWWLLVSGETRKGRGGFCLQRKPASINYQQWTVDCGWPPLTSRGGQHNLAGLRRTKPVCRWMLQFPPSSVTAPNPIKTLGGVAPVFMLSTVLYCDKWGTSLSLHSILVSFSLNRNCAEQNIMLA